MRRAPVVAIALMVCTAASAYSVSLSDLGYTVQRTYADSGVSYSDARDAQGRTVTVGVTGELTAAQGATLNQFVTAFYGLQYIKVESLKVVFTADRTQIVLIPSSFVYAGTDIASYTPSGMQFFYTTDLEYDFRVHVGTYFLRVAGTYADEKSFAERLVQVIHNPVDFLKSQNPEYMLQRIDLLEKELSDATNTIRLNQQQLAALASNYEDLQAAGKTLAEKADQIVADLETYKKANDAGADSLRTALEALRYGIMVLHNRGFFGTIILPDQAAISRIVELKKASPEMSESDMLKQVRSEGFKVSNNEMFLVYALYFDQFK